MSETEYLISNGPAQVHVLSYNYQFAAPSDHFPLGGGLSCCHGFWSVMLARWLKHALTPSPPSPGDFDLQQVKESTYFFSWAAQEPEENQEWKWQGGGGGARLNPSSVWSCWRHLCDWRRGERSTCWRPSQTTQRMFFQFQGWNSLLSFCSTKKPLPEPGIVSNYWGTFVDSLMGYRSPERWPPQPPSRKWKFEMGISERICEDGPLRSLNYFWKNWGFECWP